MRAENASNRKILRLAARTHEHKYTHFDANAYFFPSSSLRSQVNMRLRLRRCFSFTQIFLDFSSHVCALTAWQTSLCHRFHSPRTEVFQERQTQTHNRNNNTVHAEPAMNGNAHHLSYGLVHIPACMRNWWWKVTRSTFLRSQRYKLIQIKRNE